MAPTLPRALVARLALVVAGLLLGLALAEGVARLWRPPGAVEILSRAGELAPDGLFQADEAAVWTPTPGFEATIRAPGHTVALRINELGTRGPALDPAASPRWLLLGDSFVFAMQVDEEDSLAGHLAAATGGEVLNAGADGYSTFHSQRRYVDLASRLDGRGLGLDRVLLVFFLGNDLSDNALYQPHVRGIWTPGHTSRAERGGGLWGPLERRSVLLGLWTWRQRLAGFDDPELPERRRWARELRPFTRAGADHLRSAMRHTGRALSELKRAATRNGHPLLVAIAPPAFAVEDHRLAPTLSLVGLDPAGADVDAPERAVAEVLAREGIEACSLTGPLRAAAEAGRAPYLAYDGHWSPAGHEVVARSLLACLGESAATMEQ